MLKFLYSSILLHHSFCRLLHSKGSYFFSYLLACVVVVFVICLISSLLSHTYPHRISRSHTKPCNARSEALYFFSASVSLSLLSLCILCLCLSFYVCMSIDILKSHTNLTATHQIPDTEYQHCCCCYALVYVNVYLCVSVSTWDSDNILLLSSVSAQHSTAHSFIRFRCDTIIRCTNSTRAAPSDHKRSQHIL